MCTLIEPTTFKNTHSLKGQEGMYDSMCSTQIKGPEFYSRFKSEY